MHAISSYRGNRPTNKQTNKPTKKHKNRQGRLQYIAPLSFNEHINKITLVCKALLSRANQRCRVTFFKPCTYEVSVQSSVNVRLVTDLAIDPGVSLDHQKCVGAVGVCFDPPSLQMSHSFIQNCCWITLQVSHRQERKSCVKKCKVKLIFQDAFRLSGTEMVACLEKQFDDLTRLILSPYFTTDLRHWVQDSARNDHTRRGKAKP